MSTNRWRRGWIVPLILAVTMVSGGCRESGSATGSPAAVTPNGTPTVAPSGVGDLSGGSPLASATRIPTNDAFVLEVNEPATREVFVSAASITIRGRTRADAVVSINDTIVEPDIGGAFAQTVPLDAGVNTIEVGASIASGEQQWIVLTVVVVPPN